MERHILQVTPASLVLDGSLEDGEAVDLYGLTVEHLGADDVDHIPEDAHDGALREADVVLFDELGQVLDDDGRIVVGTQVPVVQHAHLVVILVL